MKPNELFYFLFFIFYFLFFIFYFLFYVFAVTFKFWKLAMLPLPTFRSTYFPLACPLLSDTLLKLAPTFRSTHEAFSPSGLLEKVETNFPVHTSSLQLTFWSTPNACTPVLFGPLLHLWALSTTRHMRRKQHLRFVAWRETIMLVVLCLISDMNDSTQSTIHIPQLYVLHSRAVLALRLCMPCAFQNVRFNTGDGVGI